MDFTREPIIETVITPKEGCKIVVRSSKNVGQEEYFVDALEVVSFGKAMFFRSLEKPKPFLVPTSDYEILEVREARMVLKNVGLDRSIKIGGGREVKAKEPASEKIEPIAETTPPAEEPAIAADGRAEKKRDRRRQQRRRRGREEQPKEEAVSEEMAQPIEERLVSTEAMVSANGGKTAESSEAPIPTPHKRSLLPPPPTLISETISLYKENVLFKNAFYTKEEIAAAKAKELIEEANKKEHEPTPKEQDFPATASQISSEKEGLSPYVSFWDDITEPAATPMPFIEEADKFIEEVDKDEQPPATPEENKE